jgi:hypothetical protein
MKYQAGDDYSSAPFSVQLDVLEAVCGSHWDGSTARNELILPCLTKVIVLNLKRPTVAYETTKMNRMMLQCLVAIHRT